MKEVSQSLSTLLDHLYDEFVNDLSLAQDFAGNEDYETTNLIVDGIKKKAVLMDALYNYQRNIKI